MLRERQRSPALLGSQQGKPPNEMFNLFPWGGQQLLGYHWLRPDGDLPP